MLAFNFAGLPPLPVAALTAVQPQGFASVDPSLAFNTAISFSHQYQSAELRRRNHHEPRGPDAGPDGAELSFSCHRHRFGLSPDRRLCPARGDWDRQFLGRHDSCDSGRRMQGMLNYVLSPTQHRPSEPHSASLLRQRSRLPRSAMRFARA